MHKKLYIIILDCKILYTWATKRVPVQHTNAKYSGYTMLLLLLEHTQHAHFHRNCPVQHQPTPICMPTYPHQSLNFLSSSLNHCILLSLLSALHLFISISLSPCLVTLRTFQRDAESTIHPYTSVRTSSRIIPQYSSSASGHHTTQTGGSRGHCRVRIVLCIVCLACLTIFFRAASNSCCCVGRRLVLYLCARLRLSMFSVS